MNPYFIPKTKIYPKWIKTLNVRAETRRKHKIIIINFHDLGFDNVLDMIPKSQATKEEIDKLDFIKI